MRCCSPAACSWSWGIAVALVDRRISISERTERAAGRAGWVLAAVAAVVGIVVAIGVIGNPVDWGDQRWQDFKGDYDEGGFGSSRFSGDLGSGRYDFWRVALDDEFSESPGGRRRLRQLRRHLSASTARPARSPSIRTACRSASWPGPGSSARLLFAGFAIAAIVAAFRRRIRAGTRSAAGSPRSRWRDGLLRPAQLSGDWLWTFAAITMPVFAWMGIAVADSGPRRTEAAAPDARAVLARRRTVRIALVAAAVIGARRRVRLAGTAVDCGPADIDSAATGWPVRPGGRRTRSSRRHATSTR